MHLKVRNEYLLFKSSLRHTQFPKILFEVANKSTTKVTIPLRFHTNKRRQRTCQNRFKPTSRKFKLLNWIKRRHTEHH